MAHPGRIHVTSITYTNQRVRKPQLAHDGVSTSEKKVYRKTGLHRRLTADFIECKAVALLLSYCDLD